MSLTLIECGYGTNFFKESSAHQLLRRVKLFLTHLSRLETAIDLGLCLLATIRP